MITNVDTESNQERFKAVKGIGLYKLNYEMDLVGHGVEQRPSYIAGIIAYTNEEAVQTLVKFCKNNVGGFKGLKINEVAFEGLCHEMSEQVKNVILNGAVKEGKVVATEAHAAVLEELEKSSKKQAKLKKSIIPKEKG